MKENLKEFVDITYPNKVHVSRIKSKDKIFEMNLQNIIDIKDYIILGLERKKENTI